VKSSGVTKLLLPRLSAFVYTIAKGAYDRANRMSMECAAAHGVAQADVSSLAVCHPAHVLNFLHRTLGFAGCPTGPLWPEELRGFPCLPIVGVDVPVQRGVVRVGAVAGLCTSVASFPFTSIDDPSSAMAVVELPVGSPDLVRIIIMFLFAMCGLFSIVKDSVPSVLPADARPMGLCGYRQSFGSARPQRPRGDPVRLRLGGRDSLSAPWLSYTARSSPGVVPTHC
jgi:hypothetical protein